MLSVSNTRPLPACPAPFNLAAYVLTHADKLAEKEALVIVGTQSNECWTYAQLKTAIQGVGSGLLQTGLQQGDRVLLRLGNSADFPIAFLGAIAAGLIPVPVSAALTEAELKQVLTIIAPAAILADPSLPLPTTLLTQLFHTKTLRTWYDLPPCPYDQGAPDRPGYIVFTSGTSGTQRAVVHAHRAIWARKSMRDGWDKISEHDRVFHAGAFNWTYTLGTGLLDPWSQGATAIIPATEITPAEIPELLQQYGVTIFAAAPGIYRKILKANLPSLPTLRHGLSAGEKLSPALRKAWSNGTGKPVFEALGMSECSTFISGSSSRPAPEGTIGFPQSGRDVAVLDHTGYPVPRGQAGELAIASDDPGLFLEYLGQSTDTQNRFKRGWFCTGDSVTMREDGAIEFHGRLDDMMNAGGVRVSPHEVEAILANVSELTEIAVTEVRVKADTTVIAAFYTAPSPIDDSKLSAFASARLARYKCPRIWQYLPELPRTKTGKVNRRALRVAFESAET